MTLSVSGGLNWVNRYDYPVYDDGLTSTTIYGQARLRFRKGMKHSGWIKYRLESISDPFTSGRGLFESRGHDVLGRDLTDSLVAPYTFYYEREQLRYQTITTAPTMSHQIDLQSIYKASDKASITVGVKAKFDKNGDLDSLDVKQSSIRPTLGLNLTPDPTWSISAGYSMHLGKSRGPVTVALFDG
jgi:hypothetical protein